MDPRDKQVEGEDWERVQYCRDECLTPSSMLLRGSVNSVQQLRGRDRADCDLLVAAKAVRQAAADGLHRTPDGQCTCGALKLEENRGV